VRWAFVLAGIVGLLMAGSVAAYALVRQDDESGGGAVAASGSPTPSRAASSTPPRPDPTGTATPTSTTVSPTEAPPTVGMVDISAVRGDGRATDVAAMFDRYFSAINARDYDTALAVYDPAGSIDPGDPAQRKHFVDGVATTTESEARLLSLGDGTARVSFVSHQQAGYGPKGHENETCTRWDVTYALRSPAAHEYRIFRAASATNARC
jgi:hypothetical protein